MDDWTRDLDQLLDQVNAVDVHALLDQVNASDPIEFLEFLEPLKRPEDPDSSLDPSQRFASTATPTKDRTDRSTNP